MWTWHFQLFSHHMKSKQKLLLSKVKKICKDRFLLTSYLIPFNWTIKQFNLQAALNFRKSWSNFCFSLWVSSGVCGLLDDNLEYCCLPAQRSSVSAGAASLGPWIFHQCQQLQSDAVTPDQSWETRLKLVSPTAPHHHTIISNNNSFRLSNSSSSRESAWLVQLKLKCSVQKWQLTLSYHNWCWEFSDDSCIWVNNNIRIRGNSSKKLGC